MVKRGGELIIIFLYPKRVGVIGVELKGEGD
jgi:hypothetical protein